MSIGKLKAIFGALGRAGVAPRQRNMSAPSRLGESSRDVRDKLRRPEAEKFYNAAALDLYRGSGAVNIRPPHPRYELKLPIDWRADPYRDRSWLLYFHSLMWLNVLCYAIDNEELADVRESEESLLEELVMSFVRHLRTNPPVNTKGYWDDHATAYRCSHLSYFYAAHLEGRLTAEEDDELLASIQLHVDTLISYVRSGKWDDSNHLIFQVEGIADAWLVFGDRLANAEATIAEAVSVATRFIDASFSEEGTTGEHAAFYHGFLMHRVRSTLEYFKGIGRPLDVDMTDRLRKAAAFLWSMLPSWPKMPSFGDTQFDKVIDLRNLAPFLQAEWENDELRQWRQPELNIAPPRLLSYRQNGFYLLRNGNVSAPDALYSLFLEKRVKGPHGHWDGSSFATWRGGEPWLIDSGGPYKYGVPLRYEYFQNQIAHNTVVFRPSGEQYRSEVLDTAVEERSTWVQSLATFESGNRWLRLFGHVGDDTVVIVDWAWPTEGDGPTALFHLAPQISVDAAEFEVRLTGHGHKATMTFATPDGPATIAEGASWEKFQSIATAVDTKFVETPIVARVLQPGIAHLSVVSFGGLRANSVREGDAGWLVSLRSETGIEEHAVALRAFAAGVAPLAAPGGA